MNELDNIRNWLNSTRDFDAGFALYVAYINHAGQRDVLARTRNQQRLFEALRDRYFTLKDKAAPAQEKQPPPAAADQPATPAELNLLDNEWHDLKNELEVLHTKMVTIGDKPLLSESDKKQRAEFCEMMLPIEARLAELATAYTFLKQYGSLPVQFSVAKKKPVKPLPETLSDANRILLLKNSINPNISKLKKKIAQGKAALPTLSGKQFDKQQTQLATWEQQLIDLEQQKQTLSA